VIPTIDERVIGLDVIRWSFPPKKWQSLQRVETAAKQSTGHASPPPINDSPRPPEPPSAAQPPMHGAGAATASYSERCEPESHAFDVDTNSPFFLKVFPKPEKEAGVKHPEIIASPSASSFTSALPRGPNIRPRWVRYAFYGCFRLAPFVVILFLIVNGGTSPSEDVRVASVMFGVVGLFLWYKFGALVAYPFSYFAMAAIYNSIRCPGCGEAQPVISRWSCACGYNDHRDKNFFLVKCPKCGSRPGYVNCQLCDATVLC
jgi:hypothetical protein